MDNNDFKPVNEQAVAVQSAIQFTLAIWHKEGLWDGKAAVDVECLMDFPITHAVVIWRKDGKPFAYKILDRKDAGFEVVREAEMIADAIDQQFRKGL